MSCTTVLVGRNASNDRSTMIARTDDGHFDTKKLVVVEPKAQKRHYKSVISHVEIDLPDDPMRYTACPSVDPKEGIWAATGINAAGVGMTATETITSNPRVLAADPLVELKKAKSRREKEIPGGIGEEDIVVLVLPYIHSVREGVLRLAGLLEQYGTYESNGIAFNDENEVWWMETIGGHHWMAKRVPDDVCVIMPNQFGMDSFDLNDAFGKKKEHLCSADLREFIRDNDLDLNQDGKFNPRDIFGSHSDMDHIYNTPRAWFMGRYLTPLSHKWDGPDAEFGPESDNIPWSLRPDRKIAVEDVKYLDETAAKLLKILNEKCFEDDRFIRGFREDGKVIGSKKDNEANMWLNPQSWAVISRGATPEQAEIILNTACEKLNTPYGLEVMQPSYRYEYFEGARMRLFNPGPKENGGIFCQPQGWAILAEALCGHGNRAFRYFQESSPASFNDDADRRVIEPYVHGQFIEGHESPFAGRSHVHWLTGTASTVMVGCVEGILGLRPTPKGIEIAPAIPQEWDGFTMEKVFRGKKLHITVDNSAHKEGKPVKVILNGTERVAGLIPEGELKDENQITVVM